MGDVNFDCPFCGQNLDAPEDLVGMNVPCPACGKIIRVIEPVRRRLDAQRIAPPPPPAPVPQRDDLEATTRIELPPEYQTPERKHRVIFIKRPGR